MINTVDPKLLSKIYEHGIAIFMIILNIVILYLLYYNLEKNKKH